MVVEGGRVVAASPQTTGVRPGMSRRQAEGACPGAVVAERDPGEETRRFEPVVAALERVVARVEVAEPGLAFLPVGDAVRYYGGEHRVVEAVATALDAVAPGAHLGIAEGPFAARWAAVAAAPGVPKVVDDTAGFLGGLDVRVLDDEELIDTFRWLGMDTLGAVAALPREALASRFGEQGVKAHRLACGEDRMLSPRTVPSGLAVEERFDPPLELADQVGFAARALAARLVGSAQREGVAPHRMVVEVESAEGEVCSRVWRSADPFTEQAMADRVWWQLRAWIDRGEVTGGVARLRLDPSDLSGEGRQLSLLDGGPPPLEAERALARAQTLVGPDAVLQAVPQGGRMPVEQVAWYRWGEEPPAPQRDPSAPWPGATPPPYPALVPPHPFPVEVEWEGERPLRLRLGSRWEPVIAWAGPWRLVGRWWRGEGTVDRYQLVTPAGAFLCTVTEEGSFLVGVYD